MSKILVVDDNELNLRLACDALELAGHEVLRAANGSDAIDTALSERPNMILMDLRMPVMNGEEAMQRIKADVSTRDIPVVALTASAMAGEREQLLAAGFDGYISKPIDVTSFAGEVARFLPEKQCKGPQAGASGGPGAAANDARITLLVVDDHAANSALITEILAADGREIVSAASGAQALACAAEKPPDLILLDIMMPDMNGLEVLRRLRGDAATAKTPVIMVTVLGDQETMAQALASGADAVLTKPVNAADLSLLVMNMLLRNGVRS